MKKPVDQFLDFLKYEMMYSQSTIIAYRKDLRDLIEFGVKVYETEDFFDKADRMFFRRWMANLNVSKMTKSTVQRKISSVKSFFRYLNEKKIIENNSIDMVMPPKMVSALPDFLNEEQVKQILENANEDSFTGKRDLAILELLYSTGVRLSELLIIKVDEISFNRKTIKIKGKGSKDRVVPIGDTALKAIKDYLKYRQELLESKLIEKPSVRLFITKRGKGLYPMAVQRMVREHLYKVAGIYKLNPHIFRHSFATHMLDNGADIRAVKDLLGHESLSTTQKYTHLSTKKLKEAYKFAHPRSEEGDD